MQETFIEELGEIEPALYWLTKTANPYPFASNVFTREDIEEILKKFQLLPNVRAYIRTTMFEADGPYSDCLYLDLSKALRLEEKAVWELIAPFNPDDREEIAPGWYWLWWD